MTIANRASSAVSVALALEAGGGAGANNPNCGATFERLHRLQRFKTLAECNEARLARGAGRENRAIRVWDIGDGQAGEAVDRVGAHKALDLLSGCLEEASPG